jgi:hypothetical protein
MLHDQLEQQMCMRQIVLEEVGESFYQSMMKDMVKLYEEKGLVTMDEGRKV